MADPHIFDQKEIQQMIKKRRKRREAEEEGDEDDDESIVRKVIILEVMRRNFQNTSNAREDRQPNVDRSRLTYASFLYQDYFSANAPYKSLFRRIFRVPQQLYNRIILDNLCQNYPKFRQQADACGVIGLSPQQKLCAVLEYCEGSHLYTT